MKKEIQDIYLAIAQGVYAQLPNDGWLSAIYRFRAISRMAEQQGYYTDEATDGSNYYVVDGPARRAFEKLRAEMAKIHENGHAWYTVIFTLTPDGKFKFDFDYDHLPTFDIMPSPDKWLDEFKHYPRPELQAQIQDWIDGKIGYDDAGHAEIIERLQRLAS